VRAVLKLTMPGKRKFKHKVELIVDTAERASKNAGEKKTGKYIVDTLSEMIGREHVERSSMDVGDYAFRVDGAIVIRVERKTLNDLAHSIRSNGKQTGFREQKRRLLEKPDDDPERPCSKEYLVEGDMSKFKERPGYSKDILMGAIVNCERRDSLVVHRTLDIQETMHWLKKTFDKLQEFGFRGKRRPVPGSLNGETDHAVGGTLEYVDTLRHKKSNVKTPRDCFIEQLTIIDGVSMNLAKAISKKHATMGDFLAYLSEKEFDAKCLVGFEYVIEKRHVGGENTSRKIGKKTAEKIIHFLC